MTKVADANEVMVFHPLCGTVGLCWADMVLFEAAPCEAKEETMAALAAAAAAGFVSFAFGGG